MEKNSNPLINSQNQAKEIFDRVHEGQIRSGVATTAEIEQIRREYIERAQRRIDIYRENEQEYLENMMREIDEKRVQTLRKIQIAYNENSDKWINDIFKSIISTN